ncbi:unnamed protein product [Rotaria sp. Silwood1]|nr:unnamed protein product [Rotaria sp. Silwood1]
MHRSILFILCLAIIHLNHACYITNCPIGGKRNLHFDNNLHNHQCPRCGLNGQCFGPSICCTGLACRIGNPSDIRQCSLEDRNVIPCEIKTTICSALPNGRCAANGVCCGIEELSLVNYKPQNRKQSYESNSNNQTLSLIEYLFLTKLYISDVHDDYIEQFLFHTKTYLQNNIIVYVDYESLQRVTHNFTRDSTRTNCAKISKLHFWGQEKPSNSLEEYFPYAKICYGLY